MGICQSVDNPNCSEVAPQGPGHTTRAQPYCKYKLCNLQQGSVQGYQQHPVLCLLPTWLDISIVTMIT